MRKTANMQNHKLDKLRYFHMNTSTLIHAIAEGHDLTKTQAKGVVQTVTNAITDALANGDKVQITDLGTFDTKQTQERQLNAVMGGGIAPARTKPTFKPAKALKDSVNQ